MTYLIVGTNPDSIESVIKRLLSTHLPQSIENYSSKLNPDIHFLEPAKDKTQIGIEEALAFIKLFARKPHSGKCHIGIIRSIHTATPEAQTALLKTFEDHADNTIFISTTHSEHSILPTITSRSQVIYTSDIESSTKNDSSIVKLFANPAYDVLSLYKALFVEKKDLSQEEALSILQGIKENIPFDSTNLELLQKAGENITINVNPRLILYKLYIDLKQIRET